jgi:hypothetical protein
MADKTPVPKFIYGRNPATLGRRFLEWLELFDLAMTSQWIRRRPQESVPHAKHGRGGAKGRLPVKEKGERFGHILGHVRKMLEDHLKPKTVVFKEVMVFRRVGQ